MLSLLPSWHWYSWTIIALVVLIGAILEGSYREHDKLMRVADSTPNNRDVSELKLIGPHLHPVNDHRINCWLMKVHNSGPSAAGNVKMRLRAIVPKPRYGPWIEAYPFPVKVVNAANVEAFDCHISKNCDEQFELMRGWLGGSENNEFFTRGLDTKSKDNPIKIEPDERWTLTYDASADNADTVSFSLFMFVKDGAVMMERGS